MGAKLQFKEVEQGELRFIKPTDFADLPDEQIEGAYIENREDNYGNPSYKLRTADGIVVVNSAGQLDSKMAEVAVGELVRITYMGQEKMKTGKWKGKLAHQFKVESAEVPDGPTTETEEAEEDKPAPTKSKGKKVTR